MYILPIGVIVLINMCGSALGGGGGGGGGQ